MSRKRGPVRGRGILFGSHALSLLIIGSAAGQETHTNLIQLRPTVVTGTYLESADAAGTLTVTPVDLAEPINQSYSTIADVLRTKLPQYGGPGSLNPAFGNGGDGNSYVALRGLPGNATLVLVNGRRTAVSALNLIPSAAVERIEILNDGGSAVYGSDAVAGVVNIVLKRQFQGTRVAASYGFTTQTPSVNERRFQLLSGDATAKGSFVISAEYQAADGLYSPDRSPSDRARGTSANGNPGTFSNGTSYGTHTNSAGALVPNGVGLTWFVNPEVTRGLTSSNQVPAGFNPLAFADTSMATTPAQASAMRNAEAARLNDLLGPDSPVLYGSPPRFPYSIYTTLYRPYEKYDFSGTGEYQLLGEAVNLFVEAYYVNYRSQMQLAPSPLRLEIPLDNYWLQQVFPGDHAGVLNQNYRIVELGPRRYEDEFNDFRFVGGLRGKIPHSTWKWELGYLFDRTEQFQTAAGGVVMSKLNQLLAITDSPAAWNPFGYVPVGGRSTVNDVSPLADKGSTRWLTTVQGIDFGVSGAVVELPGGEARVALGLAERRDSFDQQPDLATKEGLISPFTTYDEWGAVRASWAGFGEIVLPIFGPDFNLPGFAEFSLSAALRYEDYDDIGDTGVLPRLSGRWVPVRSEAFTLRGSYAEGFSAPAFADLYAPPYLSYFAIYDPYTGLSTQPLEAVLVQGNPNLKPTDSKSWLIGGEYSPKFLKSLTLGLNYFRIEQEGVPYNNINYSVNQWYLAGGNSNPNNPWGPNAVPGNRNPAGTQVEYDDATQRFIQIRNQSPINAGSRSTDGLDFQIAHAVDTGPGTITLSGLATCVLSFEQQDVATGSPVDYLGRYWGPNAAFADTSYPEWRANLSLAYSCRRVYTALGLNFTDSYIESYNQLDRQVDPYITLDLRLGYKIPAIEAELLLAVNNLLDRDPSSVYSSFENSFDRAIADPRGRMIIVSLSKHF